MPAFRYRPAIAGGVPAPQPVPPMPGPDVPGIEVPPDPASPPASARSPTRRCIQPSSTASQSQAARRS